MFKLQTLKVCCLCIVGCSALLGAPEFEVQNPYPRKSAAEWIVPLKYEPISGWYLIPLLQNLSVPVSKVCDQSQDICCLAGLEPSWINSALKTFVSKRLTPCDKLIQSHSTEDVFASENPDFLDCTAGVCFERTADSLLVVIPEEVMTSQDLTWSDGQVRYLTLSFLFVQTTVMPHMQLAFMSQTIEFTPPAMEGDIANMILTSNATCRNDDKPRNSKWHITTYALTKTCGWVCASNYTQCPQFRQEEEAACEALPESGSKVRVEMSIETNTPFNDFTYNQYDELTQLISSEIGVRECYVVLHPRITASKTIGVTVWDTDFVNNATHQGQLVLNALNSDNVRSSLSEMVGQEVKMDTVITESVVFGSGKRQVRWILYSIILIAALVTPILILMLYCCYFWLDLVRANAKPKGP